MQKEERFWETLKDIFIGEKIEGDSGFVNLMKIKSSYFDAIFKELEHEINEGTASSPDFREELYDKLYSFFKRYFSESGSIYFTYTPLKEQVYEKVYTNVDDVTLFWKTHMLYYVKTDQIWRTLSVTIQDTEGVDWEISFDVSQMHHKQTNEQRQLLFELKEFDTNIRSVTFKVLYATGGSKTKVNQIVKELTKNSITLNEVVIEKSISMFLRQNEVDFFINKDAEGFLKEQFDVWMKTYLLDETSVFDEVRLRQLKFLRTIAYKVVEFVAKFEEELTKIWNKPKCVLSSNYIITLDRILKLEQGIDVLKLFLSHTNISNQLQEWHDLGMVDEEFTIDDIWSEPFLHLDSYYQYLPIDTRYFPDLTLKLLSNFENLDTQIDGWLIRSENYQALNTISKKYQRKIKSIYIDPPYNRPSSSSEIIYLNRFKHSSWLTMMYDRIEKGKLFLSNDGNLCLTIDDFEYHRLRSILGNIFDDRNITTVVIKNNPSGRSTVKGFSHAHEYAIFAKASEDSVVGTIPRTEEQLKQYSETDEEGQYQWRNFMRRGGKNDFRSARPKLHYPLIISGNIIRIPKMSWNDNETRWILEEEENSDEDVIWPAIEDEEGTTEYSWRLGVASLQERLDDTRITITHTKEKIIQIKFYMSSPGILPKTVWDDKLVNATEYGTKLLNNIMGVPQSFDFPKSIYAVMRCIRVCNVEDTDYVLDYFAGSGTTGHAVINLNKDDGGKRKYILIEMAGYFDEVLIPRIKKVIFSNEWTKGKANRGQGISHFVKYYYLEQYEQTLRNCIYRESHPLQYEGVDTLEMIHSYLFLDDKKLLDSVKFDGDSIEIDLRKIYSDIDIAETLANLRGTMIRKINENSVEFEDGEHISFGEIKFSQIRELIWW
ncbi:MAG: site-specific DNA-methyltransferase [Candidatus Thorarchaeota archaeon]